MKCIQMSGSPAAPSGTLPHPPNTDRREVRDSITLQFNGTASGAVVAHLFSDGTIKTSFQMHAENNARRVEDARLTAAEAQFPTLHQTAARRQAEARMLARIQTVRMNPNLDPVEKQVEKDAAEHDYRVFVQAQAQARARAAQGP